MKCVEINIDRLRYLLTYFCMSEEDLMARLNECRKRPFNRKDIFSESIQLSLLRKIDAIFQCGLNFYFDYTPLPVDKSTSVFFRKKKFGVVPNDETRRTVMRFEALKNILDGYSALSDDRIVTSLKKYSLKDNPENVAKSLRSVLIPQRSLKKREFLKAMINYCADQGIYVFEFIETWNKKEKANIDGMYVSPNMIVLKHQKWYKREVFTLAHEIGHLLLRKEEMEQVMPENPAVGNMNRIEQWCNEFAFHLIVGEDIRQLDAITEVNVDNDYAHELVDIIADKTHISRLSLYTHMYYQHKLPQNVYTRICEEGKKRAITKKKEEKAKEEEKRFIRPPKPIISRLYLETMQYAYYKGIVNEATFCQQLHISASEAERRYLC